MPSSNLPTTHRALVVTEKGKVALKEVPIPKLEDDQVLVRVKAVAINPIDWKVSTLFTPLVALFPFPISIRMPLFHLINVTEV
jgi:NADPH:quinone reductase-like Zn-dependent oxidoreductase